MTHKLSMASVARMRGTLAAVALTAACSAGWALPTFTFNPAAPNVGLTGSAVTADNFIVSQYATVSLSPTGTSFREQGYLSVQSLQSGGSLVNAGGLNSTYGLYIAFEGTGTLSSATTVPSTGTFTSLSYTLFGHSGGPAKFDFDRANNATTVATTGAPIVLATGSLISGGVGTSARGALSADATVTLTPASSGFGSGFFTSPTPFYSQAQTSFIAAVDNVVPFSNGFRITQGGGSFSLAVPIPEPETYAMMLAGLAAVGFAAKRRKR